MSDVIYCVDCEKQLSPDEIEDPHLDTNGDVVCQGCYESSFDTPCAKCGEMMEFYCAEEPGRFISVDWFMSLTHNLPKGVYRIEAYPFFDQDNYLIPSRLSLVTSEPAGPEFHHICPNCSAYYQEKISEHHS